MPAFEVLLHRYCTRRGLNGVPPDDDRGLLERVFRRWAEAERAMRQGQPRQALRWLEDARGLSDVPLDSVVDAELLAGETRCWVALDEPREAISPARASWQRWLDLANGPSLDVIVPAARALLIVLSSPDPPPKLSDTEIFTAWLADRLAVEFARSATLVLGLLADVHRVDLAEEVAENYLGWIDRFAPAADLVRARFALTLGDVYDRCGDSERALTVLRDGLRRLEGFADQPEIVILRGQLTFNSANQYAKLGQLENALEAFSSATEVGEQVGVEAALRTRYAVAFTKYQLGRDGGLIEELAELAARYEDVLAESTAGGSDLDVRQGLDLVYRLWLKLEAARLDPTDSRAVVRFLHLVFALKEEEGKFCRVLRTMEQQPDAAFHSEITVLLERLQTTSTGVLVIESVPDAVILVSLAPGRGDVAVQLLDRDAAAVVGDLIAEQRLATDRLSGRVIPAASPPSPRHVQVCQAMWQALDPEIREHIDGVRVLAVVMDSSTDLGELPIEILHDGTTYLGLRQRIVRSPALRDLNLSLSRNLVNARPTGAAIVVRAEDALVHADAETTLAVAAAADLGMTASVHRGPEPSALVHDLGAGIDLLHYVGHGLADRIGEELPLGPGKRLTARGFEAIRPAPAPFTLLSACLAGRSRQLRTGHEHGFVTALVRAGAPGAIAAAYMVPDHLAAEFTALLYYFAKDAPLADAVLLARQQLAEDGYHPAAWGCFVQHGAADLYLGRPHLNEPSTWSEWAARYLASGSEDHLRAARDHLRHELPTHLAQAIDDDLRALAEHDADHFTATDHELPHTSQAAIVVSMLRSYGELRHTAVDRERKAQVIVAQARSVERILGDSYLLIAAAVELRKHLLPFGDNKTFLDAALRRLHWLTADDEQLDRARRALKGEEAHV